MYVSLVKFFSVHVLPYIVHIKVFNPGVKLFINDAIKCIAGRRRAGGEGDGRPGPARPDPARPSVSTAILTAMAGHHGYSVTYIPLRSVRSLQM